MTAWETNNVALLVRKHCPNVMTVGTSNKCAVNMKIMTRTLQTEANRKFGKEKVKKTVSFLDKTFFLGNFLYF